MLAMLASPQGPNVGPDPDLTVGHPSERHLALSMLGLDGGAVDDSNNKIFSAELDITDTSDLKPFRSSSCGAINDSPVMCTPGDVCSPLFKPCSPLQSAYSPNKSSRRSTSLWPASAPRPEAGGRGPRGDQDGNPARRSLRRFSSGSLTDSHTSSLGDVVCSPPEAREAPDQPSSLPTVFSYGASHASLLPPGASFITPEKGRRWSEVYVPMVMDKSLQETNARLQKEVLLLSEEKKKRFSTLREQAEDFGLLLVERERVQHEKVRGALQERVRALEDELAETLVDLEEARDACKAKDKENAELRALATNLAQTLYGGEDADSDGTPGRRRRRGAYVRAPLPQNCEVAL
mmetsp:Transcript_3047/g.7602  ORF Transcript_3047/g.7602 Transcript_3047/m.7602 type:complete len:349 (-) Transcript_3047:546-1592(-)